MREKLASLTRRLVDGLEGLADGLFGKNKKDAEKAAAAEERFERKRQALIKDRPASLEQRYRPLDDAEVLDALFRRLQRHVYQAIDAGAGVRPESSALRVKRAVVFREAGKLAAHAHDESEELPRVEGRPYFYLKPAGHKGWLFERSGAGWIVARAEKDARRGLFMRDGASYDHVTLYMADDGAAFPRVRSRALGGDLISFAVYEQKVLSTLDAD